MAAGRHLGFDITQNSAIRYADPENPTLEEPNMKCIGSLVAEIWPFVYNGGIWYHSKERWRFPISSPL